MNHLIIYWNGIIADDKRKAGRGNNESHSDSEKAAFARALRKGQPTQARIAL